MQPASTPFPGGYVPAAGPFAMQGAVGAAMPTQTMTGPMQPNVSGRRRGFQHDGDDDDDGDGDDDEGCGDDDGDDDDDE